MEEEIYFLQYYFHLMCKLLAYNLRISGNFLVNMYLYTFFKTTNINKIVAVIGIRNWKLCDKK